MNVGDITAISAVIIAIASLSVTIIEAKTARRHNRESVRPILRIIRVRQYDDSRVGFKLRNVGLGPAIIAETTVTLDGDIIGGWDRDSWDLMTGSHHPTPKFSALYIDDVIPAGYETLLIFIEDFQEKQHAWFWELVAHRVSIEVRYKSIYGDKVFSASKHPR